MSKKNCEHGKENTGMHQVVLCWNWINACGLIEHIDTEINIYVYVCHNPSFFNILDDKIDIGKSI